MGAKKIIQTATEKFNTKPKDGIAYMINERLIAPDDPEQVAQFLRTNPQLSKNQMGDYISSRQNLHILKAFVESFDFTGLRIDASLRMYLETFRFVFYSSVPVAKLAWVPWVLWNPSIYDTK